MSASDLTLVMCSGTGHNNRRENREHTTGERERIDMLAFTASSGSQSIVTILIAVALIIYLLARQFFARPVSQRTLFTPLILAAVLGALFIAGAPTFAAVIAVVCGLLVGAVTGAIGGSVTRVWRGQGGLIYQKSGWPYLLVLLGFIALRVAAYFLLHNLLAATALDDAFIAAVIANYLGRGGVVVMRALPMVGNRFEALPGR